MSSRDQVAGGPGQVTGGRRETVGFVGLGNMGWPMAANLVRAGHRVVAFDLVLGRAEDFAAAVGGRRVDDAREVGDGADAVILMLPDGDSVRDVVLGGSAPGLLESLPIGALVIDASSSAPSGTVELGNRLEVVGVRLVDAPVSGGVTRAKAATLSAMVGGDEKVVEAARPLLSSFATTILHAGPLGAGHAAKALNNAVSAAGLVAAAEAIVVAARFGVKPPTMLDVLNASTGRNFATETKFSEQVFSAAYASGFQLGLLAKDLRIAVDLACELEVGAEVAERVLQTLEEARSELAPDADHTEVARFLAERGRVSLEQGELEEWA